jgi:hypothetical protein
MTLFYVGHLMSKKMEKGRVPIWELRGVVERESVCDEK